MSRSIHFISRSIPGSGPPDGRCLPCLGVSGRALRISPKSSHAGYKLVSNTKSLSLKCPSRYIVCNSSSTNYRRNPDSSGQNNRKFSRNRNNNNNRHNNKERDGYEDLEGPDTFSSRNGPLFSVSANQKFQATATPGPREKEIVEIFKKVQAQLRERAAVKEEGKNVEKNSQGKSKESETVDSLLKLLRKHSVQQGKKSYISADNRDFVLNQNEQVVASTESTDHVKREIQESQGQNLCRPKSSFRKRSPVPEIKFQPIYSEGSVGSVSHENLDGKRKPASSEPEAEEVQSDSESDLDPLFSEGNELDEISEDEISEFYENEHGGIVAEERIPVEGSGDLSGMKLPELRAIAKSRGMKGYSKLKKSELVELLSGSI